MVVGGQVFEKYAYHRILTKFNGSCGLIFPIKAVVLRFYFSHEVEKVSGTT